MPQVLDHPQGRLRWAQPRPGGGSQALDTLGYRAKNIVLPLPEGERKVDLNEYFTRDGKSKDDWEQLFRGLSGSPYKVKSLREIRNEPPPEAQFIVGHGILPKGGRLLVRGAPKVGKAQPLDTPVLTPRGWRKMGWLKEPLHEVIGSDGAATKITHVWPQGTVPIYRVTASDGASTESCSEHLWQVQDRNQRKSGPRVLSTMDLADAVEAGREMYLPLLSAPVQYQQASPPDVAPYALGALLGDGSFRVSSPSFSSGDEEMFDLLQKELPGLLVTRSGPYGAYISDPFASRTVQNGLVFTLKEWGLWGLGSTDKFIPDEYFTASIDDRIALLQGLMDTDGGMERTVPTFCSTSLELAEGVQSLVESLGGTGKIRTKGTSHKDAYIVRLRLPSGICPFRLKRKVDEWMSSRPTNDTQPVRKVVSVEYVGDKPAQCITVEAPDSLYVTERYLVTHNSIFVENLCLSIAAGIPFLGQPDFEIDQTEQHRVLLLDREVSERSLFDRLNMLIDSRPGYAAAEDYLHIDHKIMFKLDQPGALDTIIGLIRANNADVLVLDTAYKFFSGDMESSKERGQGTERAGRGHRRDGHQRRAHPPPPQGQASGSRGASADRSSARCSGGLADGTVLRNPLEKSVQALQQSAPSWPSRRSTARTSALYAQRVDRLHVHRAAPVRRGVLVGTVRVGRAP